MLRRSLDLRPRLVVYGFIADHMKRNVSPCAPAYGPLCLPFSYVGLDGSGNPVVRTPDPALFGVNRRFWNEFFFSKRLGPAQVLAAAEAEVVRLTRTVPIVAPDDPATREKILERLLGDMAEAAASVEAPLLVVNLPYLERGTTNPIAEPLRDAVARLQAKAPNLAHLDLGPAVERYYASPSAPLLRFEHDRHPDPAGQALFADAIDAFVRAHHLLPAAGAAR